MVKTSGTTGLHLLTPWAGDEGLVEARVWALEPAGRTAEAMPKQSTVEIPKSKCCKRVFIDVLQNGCGHRAVPSYVMRETDPSRLTRRARHLQGK